MDLPEVERRVSRAVVDRPAVANAPLNLYIYEGRIICGSRAVMPAEADFVAHVPPDRLKNGFEAGEWKQIVEKSANLLGKAEISKLKDRRTEKRLHRRCPVWYGKKDGSDYSPGVMMDVCSQGMAFTCYSEQSCPVLGEEINARFSVPRLSRDGVDDNTFNRISRICRVDKTNGYLNKIAVQFAERLPFKPAEQQAGDCMELCTGQKSIQ